MFCMSFNRMEAGMDNLYEKIPDHLPEELTDVLVKFSNVRIERIVSDGYASPEGFWYDQNEDEWVLLVSGSAVLAFEDHEVEMGPGDHLLIPAHQKHRVVRTSSDEKTIWLAVFYENNTL
jgi:cupin 2 domain-containing protein